MLKRLVVTTAAVLWLTVGISASVAETIDIRLPALSGKRHLFFAQVFKEALQQDGLNTNITFTDILPQARVWFMLEHGEIDLFWALQTAERDQKYLPAGQRITNGIFGQRVLLIRPTDKEKFAKVKTVDEFRSLEMVGGFGKGWFDLDVWNLNQLPAMEFPGDWTTAFKGVAMGNHGVDYLSRSILEVQEEMEENGAGLMIEPTLLLSYSRDARFYLAPGRTDLQKRLNEALLKAEKSGLIKRITNTYFREIERSLKLSKRVRLNLKTPEVTSTPVVR